MDELLRMEGITKSFPGVKALDGANLTVRSGTVHALMGENGAGKSTLMKCLFGVYSKDSGRIILDGREVSFKGSREALDGGVAMVHQELNQAQRLSVKDNLWMGRSPRITRHLPFTSERRARDLSESLFADLGIKIEADTKLGELSVSKRQMLEIAKAVSFGARVIVFDEPTSSLSTHESEKLFEIIGMLRKRGCGIIYISHKMSEILRISDEVTVMRDGRTVASRSASELSVDEIIQLMVGRELGGRFPERKATVGEVKLEADGLYAVSGAPSDASFSLRSGEILGVAGLDGSGRTELLQSLFGITKLKAGSLKLSGKEISVRTPREAIRSGIALITEERRRDGIFGALDLIDNTTVSSLRRYKRGPLLSGVKMKSVTEDGIKRLRVKAPSPFTRISTLSGGNQQKIILSRWLLTDPEVLLLDEPTRGIDVGAKYEIYEILFDLAARGKSIIAVSSEMEELIGISDRILVMSGGRIAGILDKNDATQEGIMALATKYL